MLRAGIAPYTVRVAFVGMLDHDTNGRSHQVLSWL
jgi:hypothetical protein